MTPYSLTYSENGQMREIPWREINQIYSESLPNMKDEIKFTKNIVILYNSGRKTLKIDANHINYGEIIGSSDDLHMNIEIFLQIYWKLAQSNDFS